VQTAAVSGTFTRADLVGLLCAVFGCPTACLYLKVLRIGWELLFASLKHSPRSPSVYRARASPRVRRSFRRRRLRQQKESRTDCCRFRQIHIVC
jgi:hypothetical protein